MFATNAVTERLRPQMPADFMPLASRDDVQAPNQRGITIIRWLFYAFIFSLSFETAGEDIGMIEPPTVVGGALLLSTLLQPGLLLRWPPAGFWCFIIYFYLFVATGLLFEESQYRALFLQNVMIMGQLTLLAWVAFNLMRDSETARKALISLAAASVVLSVIQILGVAQGATEVKGEVERAAALGFHPNHLARILVLGILALMGMLYIRKQLLSRKVLFASPLIVILVAVLIQTGSRGALLALAAALLTFALSAGSLKRRAINAGGLLVLLGLLALAAVNSDIMRSRFEETIEDGDLARRELIYPMSWQMFTEKPLLGWGSATSVYELGMRLGHPEEETKNPHNLILYGLVTSGVVGSFPLFLGTGLAIFAAWRARHRAHGILPLAMVVAVLVANMSGVWIANKLHWLVIAYALASAHYELRTQSTDILETKRQVDLTHNPDWDDLRKC